jgi:fibronectin type III domain protein
MAGTVKVPGLGNVKTTHLVIGGVAVAGIAGFAWIRHLNSAPVEEAPATADFTEGGDYVYGDPGDAFATDYAYDGGAYPYPSYTTPSYGMNTTVQTPDPVTNQEWTARGIEHLEMVGVEAGAASLALSRYLLKECLTATQADIVRQAVGRLGPPPQQSFSIIVCPSTPPVEQPPNEEPPPTTSAPKIAGKVSGLRLASASRTSVLVDWQPAAHSEGYGVYVNGVRRYEPRWSSQTVSGLKPNTSYTIGVVPRPDAGYTVPAMTTITVRTKK